MSLKVSLCDNGIRFISKNRGFQLAKKKQSNGKHTEQTPISLKKVTLNNE
jgi:hypothetical protein